MNPAPPPPPTPIDHIRERLELAARVASQPPQMNDMLSQLVGALFVATGQVAAFTKLTEEIGTYVDQIAPPPADPPAS